MSYDSASVNSEISKMSNLSWQEPNEKVEVCVVLSAIRTPDEAVKEIAAIKGPVDVYCWYEGPKYLPKIGADFMKSIFAQLFALKKDAKLCLYSLRAWDVEKGQGVTEMPASTLIGEAINRIDKSAVECFYSSAFFQYCAKVEKEKSDLYTFINTELPQKKWLIVLSENRKQNGIQVKELFNNDASLLDFVQDWDFSIAYSSMQYVEGYYQIRESVQKGLSDGRKKIEIAFLLPNDEGKYYTDYSKDIKKMLWLDFGKKLDGIPVKITFEFFKFTEESRARPYLGVGKDEKVKKKEVRSYFDYLSKEPVQLKQQVQPKEPVQQFIPQKQLVAQPSDQKQSQVCIPRDIIHNLNGWY